MERIYEQIRKKDIHHYRNLMDRNSLQKLKSIQHMEVVASKYLEHLIHAGQGIEDIVDSYLFMTDMVMEEELYFYRNNRYRYSKFNDVWECVYNKPDLMSKYMIGLGLSQFLWTTHMNIYSFFQKHISQLSGGGYLEIGPGHGLYITKAMLEGKFSNYVGVDISSASINRTQQMIGAVHDLSSSTFELKLCDFFDYSAPVKSDLIVAGEVLEHVEDPKKFLIKIKSILSEHGKAFITTCANSPAIDHIYLFKSIDDIRIMLHQAGFAIDDELVDTVSGKDIEVALKGNLSVNYAVVVSHGAENAIL